MGTTRGWDPIRFFTDVGVLEAISLVFEGFGGDLPKIFTTQSVIPASAIGIVEARGCQELVSTYDSV